MFRALFRMNFRNADLLGQITHFRFAIAGKDHDALKLMFWPEMLNKRTSFGTRRIAQPEGRGKLPIDYDDTLETTGDRWKMLGAWRLLRKQLAAAGDLNVVTGDGSSQSLTRRFAHVRCLFEVKPFRFGGGEDGSGQWML